MKSVFTIGGSLLVTALFGACATTGVKYSVLYPPEIALPEGESRMLGIVTWFDTTQFNSAGNKKDRVIVESYHYFTETLTAQLESMSNVLLITPTIALERSRTHETPPDLAPDLVRTKCERLGVNYFLVIEEYEVSRHKSLVLFKGDVQSRSIQTSVTLTLYSGNGNRLDRSQIVHGTEVDSEEIDGFMDGVLGSKPSVKRNAHLLDPQSQGIVDEYIQKFRPLTKEEYRLAYSKEEFVNFVPYINHREFQEAEDLMLPFTNSTDRKMAKRAAYNMYILREAEGKLIEAQEWLKKHEAL